MKFKRGDAIYYFKGRDTFPGVVLTVGKCGKIRIRYDHFQGDLVRWVSIHNIEPQNPCPACGQATTGIY